VYHIGYDMPTAFCNLLPLHLIFSGLMAYSSQVEAGKNQQGSDPLPASRL